MSKLWNPLVSQLSPYTPGEQPVMENLIKLNTNENPYGPSPATLAALQQQVSDSLRLYPDPACSALKQATAQYYGVNTNQVFVGNGSDEVLAHAFLGLFNDTAPILFPDITYSFYTVYAKLYQREYLQIPLNDSFEIQPGDYRQANGGIIFPNPNAPTGRLLGLQAVEDILQHNSQSVVIVDEAYIDFGGESAVKLVNNYPNLLVIQTLSKSRSLAGLRVGFGIAQAELIEALERIKNSFNPYTLDRFALAGASAAIQDKDYFESTRQRIIESRENLSQALGQLDFEVIPSMTNFVLVRHRQRDAQSLFDRLRERHIIVRHFKQPRIENYLRISIGTEQQCATLIQALQEILDS